MEENDEPLNEPAEDRGFGKPPLPRLAGSPSPLPPPSTGGRKRILFGALAVGGGLACGMMFRACVGEREEEPIAPAETTAAAATSRKGLGPDATQMWSRLMTVLTKDRVPQQVMQIRQTVQRQIKVWLEASEEPGITPPPAKTAPTPKIKQLPLPPDETREQKAARLWQGGVLATREGDYPAAIRQFQECLAAEPQSDRCRSGLDEARRRQKWNQRKKR